MEKEQFKSKLNGIIYQFEKDEYMFSSKMDGIFNALLQLEPHALSFDYYSIEVGRLNFYIGILELELKFLYEIDEKKILKRFLLVLKIHDKNCFLD